MATRKSDYSRLQALLAAWMLAFACRGSRPEAPAPPRLCERNCEQEDAGTPIVAPPPQYGNRLAEDSSRAVPRD
jgi:hypothetical protein